mgnify:CR=1 FL=1
MSIAPQSSESSSGRLFPAELPVWKRLFDLVICVALLPMLAGLTLLMTLVTLVRAPGPVLYRQAKTGYRGRRIMIYRFRTLRISSDGRASSVVFGEPPPRVPLGGFLRFTGLGELPQILNVLRGDMTLVGPRPLAVVEGTSGHEFLQQGWASVPGVIGLPRNSNHLADWLAADQMYAATLTWWGDVGLLFRAGLVLVLRVLGFGSSRLNRDLMAFDPGDSTILVPGESRRPW